MPFDLAQIVGIIAAAFVICGFALKNDNQFKACTGTGCLLFSLHFFLLGAYAGSAVNFANTLLSFTSIYFHRSNKFMYLFFGLYATGALIVVDELIDILPFATGILGAYAVFQLSGITLRLVMLLSSSLWMIYNILFLSIGGIITECFVMSVNCITIYRIFIDLKKANEAPS